MSKARTTIAVIGSGAAGLAAAVAAAESSTAQGSDCQVIVIERAPEGQHGGNTRWSPSYIRMAAPDRVAPDFEQAFQEAAGGRADPAYVRRLVESAPETIAWLMHHGVTFDKPIYYLSVGPPRIQPIGGGAAILQRLERAARQAGVAIRYQSMATRLLMSADGAVEGVEVLSDDGTTEDISANCVILASGGFAGNGGMLARHFGDGADCLRPISPGTIFNTGEGIEMGLKAGARPAGDWNGMHAEPVDARSRASAPVVLVYPYGIVVDQTGRRFFDEGSGLVHETWEMFARTIHFSTPGRIAYAILDAKLRDIENFQRAIRSEVPPYEADSIEKLAALIDVPASALEETIARYNTAATGDPAKFDATRADGLSAAAGLIPHKSNWCRGIDKPPYLAYPLVGAIAYTFGGLATNVSAEVLGEHGPIPGLFAAGEATGHFYRLAPNAVAILRAVVFGRIAGQAAADYCRAER